MLKITMIGHLGKDAVMNVHGHESVLNFSIAHSDKWTDNGVQKERTTWVSCSWWIDSRSTIGQYLKKGTQVYIEGFPEAKMWDGNDGKKQCGLNVRVRSLQLLGAKKEGSNSGTPMQAAPQPEGYVPIETPGSDDDLPF